MTAGRGKRQVKATPAPEGLRLAFNFLRPNDGTSHFARGTADKTHEHARRVIAELQTKGDQVTVCKILDRAADAMYGSTYEQPHQMPQLAQAAGFEVGFAVCWLMMMTLNGKAGTR